MQPAPTILVVDDDPAVLKSICNVLDREAMQATAARGVKDALEHIFRRIPDLVITDICMAPLAGWDLIAHLRSRYAGLPIFVITALSLPLAGYDSLYAEAYFQKPLDFDVLVSAIRRQLGEK